MAATSIHVQLTLGREAGRQRVLYRKSKRLCRCLQPPTCFSAEDWERRKKRTSVRKQALNMHSPHKEFMHKIPLISNTSASEKNRSDRSSRRLRVWERLSAKKKRQPVYSPALRSVPPGPVFVPSPFVVRPLLFFLGRSAVKSPLSGPRYVNRAPLAAAHADGYYLTSADACRGSVYHQLCPRSVPAEMKAVRYRCYVISTKEVGGLP